MSFESRLQKIETHIGAETANNIDVDLDKFTFVVRDPNKKEKDWTKYIAPKTGLLLHKDNSFVRLMMGPYGSGKSSTCCAEIVFRAVAMPPCTDGVRRCRWAIIRNTYGDLDATTFQTWMSWFGALGAVRTRRAPRFITTHRFNDGKGIIELELFFLALDRPDQMARLKSLELTGAYLNEMCELPSVALVHLIGRVNQRYPSKKDCLSKYWAGVLADTNPPPMSHWQYEVFEVKRPSNYKIFTQPPALLKGKDGYVNNPEAENIHNLGAGYDYYHEMTHGQDEEFIKVYVQGKYGIVKNGRSVYGNYNDDLHSVEEIDIHVKEPILLAWDYGTISPACLLSQYVDGRLLVIKEFVCSYMDPKELYNASVKPFLSTHCNRMAIEVVGDPSDTYHGKAQLEECGMYPQSAKTNNIDARLSAVKGFLNRLHEGKPSILISRSGCPKLRQGFISDYNYRRLRVVGEERYMDVPDKTHPFSDIHDCLQYAALHYADFEAFEEDIKYPKELLCSDRDISNVGGY